MSDSDSDESLNTEDLNEINSTNDNQFEEEETVEVEIKGIEREKQTKKVKKSEVKEKPIKVKKERTEKQKTATARMLEANKKKKEEKLKNKIETEKPKKTKSKKEIENVITENLDEIDNEIDNEIENEIFEEVQNKKTKVKKPPTEKQLVARANLIKINKARAEARKQGKDSTGKVGRKAHSYNVIREKIIYMMPDNNGDFKRVRTPVITDKQRQKQKQIEENEEEFEQIQEKATKLLKKTRNGKVDGRSQKSPAQLKVLEKAREKAKLIRDEKLKAKREKDKNELKDTITDSVLDVVTKPASEIKEIKEKKRITEKISPKKDLSLFC